MVDEQVFLVVFDLVDEALLLGQLCLRLLGDVEVKGAVLIDLASKKIYRRRTNDENVRRAKATAEVVVFSRYELLVGQDQRIGGAKGSLWNSEAMEVHQV